MAETVGVLQGALASPSSAAGVSRPVLQQSATLDALRAQIRALHAEKQALDQPGVERALYAEQLVRELDLVEAEVHAKTDAVAALEERAARAGDSGDQTALDALARTCAEKKKAKQQALEQTRQLEDECEQAQQRSQRLRQLVLALTTEQQALEHRAGEVSRKLEEQEQSYAQLCQTKVQKETGLLNTRAEQELACRRKEVRREDLDLWIRHCAGSELLPEQHGETREEQKLRQARLACGQLEQQQRQLQDERLKLQHALSVEQAVLQQLREEQQELEAERATHAEQILEQKRLQHRTLELEQQRDAQAALGDAALKEVLALGEKKSLLQRQVQEAVAKQGCAVEGPEALFALDDPTLWAARGDFYQTVMEDAEGLVQEAQLELREQVRALGLARDQLVAKQRDLVDRKMKVEAQQHHQQELKKCLADLQRQVPAGAREELAGARQAREQAAAGLAEDLARAEQDRQAAEAERDRLLHVKQQAQKRLEEQARQLARLEELKSGQTSLESALAQLQ